MNAPSCLRIKKIILKPYMENRHPNKVSKISAPLALVRKISSKKIEKSKSPIIHALIPKTIVIENVPIIHDIFLKQLAISYESFKPFADFPKRYKTLKLYSNLQLKNYVPFKTLSKINDHAYIMNISNDWGISTSSTISEFKEFHDHKYIPIEMFSSPTPLESKILPNSFLIPPLVSNVGLIDVIIDHRTINTDPKEDDYKLLLQWKDNTISDASWITSNDPLHYAPRLHFDLFLYMKDTSSEMKSSNPGGIDGELLPNMNTRVPSEPRYTLRKRIHHQLQQHAILFLIHKFEKLTIHEVSEEDLSKSLKESVDPKGIIFPPLPFLD